MRSTNSKVVLHAVLASLCLWGLINVAAQDQPMGGDVVHAVAGVVKKVDTGCENYCY